MINHYTDNLVHLVKYHCFLLCINLSTFLWIAKLNVKWKFVSAIFCGSHLQSLTPVLYFILAYWPLPILLYRCIEKKTFQMTTRLKGIFQPKITILSSFNHPHVIPNLCYFLSPVGHKRRYFAKHFRVVSHTMNTFHTKYVLLSFTEEKGIGLKQHDEGDYLMDCFYFVQNISLRLVLHSLAFIHTREMRSKCKDVLS